MRARQQKTMLFLVENKTKWQKMLETPELLKMMAQLVKPALPTASAQSRWSNLGLGRPCNGKAIERYRKRYSIRLIIDFAEREMMLDWLGKVQETTPLTHFSLPIERNEVPELELMPGSDLIQRSKESFKTKGVRRE
ncbi:hypothetical protein NPIL_272801 [Nephila pilipes]|uniref:Uncharacterized protein n=1 Tax=Nephila pilipes TaxID=299642 RepID=A0A8X6QU88_NEPPI|nr:hypothetical protein NPIL_272801 [Nephila pilipes]